MKNLKWQNKNKTKYKENIFQLTYLLLLRLHVAEFVAAVCTKRSHSLGTIFLLLVSIKVGKDDRCKLRHNQAKGQPLK